MVLKDTLLACTPRENGLEADANGWTITTLGWKGLLGRSNAGGNV
jgi:hypothetical protein